MLIEFLHIVRVRYVGTNDDLSTLVTYFCETLISQFLSLVTFPRLFCHEIGFIF